MIKCLINRKMHQEVEKHNKKILIYTGLAISGVGVGIYLTKKAMKKCKCKEAHEEGCLSDFHHNHDCHCDHDHNYEYDFSGINLDDQTHVKYDVSYDKDKEELKQKVEEFNSNRLSSDNEEESDPHEIEKVTEKIEDDKDNTEVKMEEYKEEQYDKYEE